jgi:hypothetical protein
MATAGSIVIDLLMRTGSFETDSKRAEKRLKEFQKEAVAAGKAIGAGVAVAATALGALTWQSIQFADQLDEMSQRLGISTETLSGWGYAAKMSGTDLDSLTAAIPKLSKTLAAAADEGSKAGQLFKALGIDVKDAEGNLRDVEDVLPEIADRFKALKNDTTEAALAQELFGRSGANMLEFLNRGSEGIAELSDRAAELGLIVSGETASAAAQFNDSLEELRAVTTAFGLQIAELLLPHLQDLVDWLVQSQREGKLLGFEIRDLGGAIDYFAGELRQADNIGESFKVSIQGMVEQLAAFGDMMRAVAGRDWEQFKAAFGAYTEGQAKAIGGAFVGVPDARARQRVIFSDEEQIPRSMLREPNLPDPTARVNRFLAGSSAGAKKAKEQLSEAEKAAKRLQEQFEQTLESLTQQQYMLGKTGEEARVRYEIELGSLKELDQAKKDQLITEAAYLDALTKAHEEEEKRLEVADRITKAFERTNAEIMDQIKLVGMSADEQEIWNNLAWAGVDAESERGREIIANTQRLQSMRDAMDDQISAMDTLRDAGSDFLSDWVSGGKSFKDSFLDALDSIRDRFIDLIAENWMDQLLGKRGDPAGGSAGGWFGQLFSGMFSSGASTTSLPSSGMGDGSAASGGWGSWVGALAAAFGGSRAGGGDVIANRGYWVGENGPEWFQPRTAGTVLTTEESTRGLRGTGRAFNQTINVQVQDKRDLRSADQIGSEAAFRAQVAMRRNS